MLMQQLAQTLSEFEPSIRAAEAHVLLVNAVVVLLLCGMTFGLSRVHAQRSSTEECLLFWTAVGWGLNFIYLGLEFCKRHLYPSESGECPVLIHPGIMVPLELADTIGNACVLYASLRFVRPKPRLVSWGWLVAAAASASFAATLATDDRRWFFVIMIPSTLFNAAAWACLAWALGQLIWWDVAPRPFVRWMVVGPLAVYALVQFGFLPFPGIQDDHSFLSTVSAVSFLLGFGCKLFLLVGMASYTVFRSRRLQEQEVLRERVQFQHRFIAQMVHELKTPAAALRLLLEHFDDSSLGKAPRGVPSDTTQQFIDLTTQILTIVEGAYESINSGTETQEGSVSRALSWDETNLNNLVESAIIQVKMLRSSTKGKRNIVVRTQYARNLFVTCYVPRMRQVFTNLLNNSFDALPEQGGMIMVITSRCRSQAPGRSDDAVVTVTDDGEGIPPTKLPQVARDGYTTRPGDNRGHGLALCREIVEGEHHGRLTIESPPEEGRRGTRVRVAIPMS